MDEEVATSRHTAASSGTCEAEDDDDFADDPSGDLVTSMQVADFLAEAAPTLYFARWFGFSTLSGLRDDCEPHASLLVSEVDEADAAGAARDERRYFRLGTPGAVSSLHHDEYHNAFVQLNGSKRWWLLPPTAWQATRGFPRGHARARQSPRHPSFTWPLAEFEAAGGASVVTQRGDVLYIPPYWLHQTVTRDRSVAVNLWSPSRESRHAARTIGLASELLDASGVLLAATRGGDSEKLRALCTGALAVRIAAEALLAPSEGGMGEVRALLRELHTAHYGAHMRKAGRRPQSRQRQSSPSAPSPASCGATAAVDGDDAACAAFALDGGTLELARRLAETLAGLPEGVRTLTLADVATEIAEQLVMATPAAGGASASATWGGGERGKARVVRCLLVDLQ